MQVYVILEIKNKICHGWLLNDQHSIPITASDKQAYSLMEPAPPHALFPFDLVFQVLIFAHNALHLAVRPTKMGHQAIKAGVDCHPMLQTACVLQ